MARIHVMKDEVRSSSQATVSQRALAVADDAVVSLHDRGAKPLDVIENARQAWVAEIRLIQRHRDQAAFASLFRHFAPRVKAFLMKSGASEAMAEEVTQDVMATLWTKADQFDPTRASAATWIFTIARNRKIDMIRKQRRPEPEDIGWGPEPEPDQEEVMATQQDTELLNEALSGLPEKQRDLVHKAYYGDLSHSEIAAQTGLPLGTIKSRIRLALERLRHELK